MYYLYSRYYLKPYNKANLNASKFDAWAKLLQDQRHTSKSMYYCRQTEIFRMWFNSDQCEESFFFLPLKRKIMLAFIIQLCYITYQYLTIKTIKEVTCQEPADAQKTPLHVKPIDRHLQKINLNKIARSSQFYQRSPQKISALPFIKALCNAAYQNIFSYSKIAFLLGLLGVDVSKQGVATRFNHYAISFFKQVLHAVVDNISGLHSANKEGALNTFTHVYLQDSTNLKLPKHLADAYPGAKNQSGKENAGMKIQATFNLKNEHMADFGVSAFTRTDQAASQDIFNLVQPKDLVIRDLGYFVLSVFERLSHMGAFFLSRLKNNVAIYWPESGRRLNLLALLKEQPSADIDVLIGCKQKLAVRLVALPVPDYIANERRRKAKNNRDQRLKPSKESLKLLGWQIFVTNVGRSVWDPLTIVRLYAIRWRIEIIFKAWKSHLALSSIPQGSKNECDLYMYSQLLNITIFHAFFDHLNRSMINKHNKYISMLKLAPLFNQIVSAISLLGDSAQFEHFIESPLLRHCCYERRKDRINYAQSMEYLRCLA
jgi:hypothetical protein